MPTDLARPQSLSPRLWTLLAVPAILFPLALLLDLRSDFYQDWHNHLWQIGYYGEYLLQNGRLPKVLNTTDAVGMPFPIFYGYLFFPLLGALSTVFGESFIVRPLIAGLWALQWSFLYRALRSLDQSRVVSFGLTCIYLWSVYPLTNLYNRAALPELFATGLLNCALFLWIRLLSVSDPGRARTLICGVFACVLLFSGIHPITSVVGGFFFLIFGTLLYAFHPARRFRISPPTLALGATLFVAILMILSPWIYAAIRFQNDLFITYQSGQLPHVYGFESLASRLSPIPYDPRLPTHGDTVVTPYDDLQINISLVLLALFLGTEWISPPASSANKKSRALALSGFGLAAAALWLSLDQGIYRILPSFLSKIQITYRMITYINAALLIGVIGLLLRRGDRPWPTRSRAALGAGVALAGVSVLIKLSHGAFVETRDPAHEVLLLDSREKLVTLPETFYGERDYTTPFFFPPIPEGAHSGRADFPVRKSAPFGQVLDLDLDLSAPTYIRTNVEAFPWNHIEQDGRILAPAELYRDDIFFAISLPAGEHHLSYRFQPDPAWLVLRQVSGWCGLAVAVAFGLIWGKGSWKKPIA